MVFERPPSLGQAPGTRTLEELKRYKPPEAEVLRLETVGKRPDGKTTRTLGDIAKLSDKKDFWDYIDWLFPGCEKRPECVNWYLKHVYDCPATPDGKNRKFLGSEKIPLPKPAGTAPVNPPKPARPRPKPGLFDRWAAARFARRYAIKGHPGFPETHNGSDCTSFVSQALLFGGWSMIGGTPYDFNNDSAWWYGMVSEEEFRERGGLIEDIKDVIKDISGGGTVEGPERYRMSHTWGGAAPFARFLKKSMRAIRLRGPENLESGDILQLFDHKRNSMEHTMIVVGGRGRDLEYAQHTDNKIASYSKYLLPKLAQPNQAHLEIVHWKVVDVLK
jgi:Putative amidase domain